MMGIGKRRLALAFGVGVLAAGGMLADGAHPLAAACIGSALAAAVLGESALGRATAARAQENEAGLLRLNDQLAEVWRNLQSIWDARKSDDARLANLERVAMRHETALARTPAETQPMPQVAALSAAIEALHRDLNAVTGLVGQMEARLSAMELAVAAGPGGRRPGFEGPGLDSTPEFDRLAAELRNRLDLVVDLTTALQISVDEVRAASQRRALAEAQAGSAS